MAKISVREIAKIVAKKHKITQKTAENFVTMLFEVINEGLESEKSVKVKGLGTFKVASVKSRESINVNTGERVLIDGHDKISFTPDPVMRDFINKPFAQFETVLINDGVDFGDIDAAHADELKEEENEETPAVEEKTAVEETPKAEEQPATEEQPVTAETPKTKIAETPLVEEPHVEEEQPVATEQPIAVDQPVVEEQATADEPTADEQPVADGQPAAEEEENLIKPLSPEKREQHAVFKEKMEALAKVASQPSHLASAAGSGEGITDVNNRLKAVEKKSRRNLFIACAFAVLALGLGYLLGRSHLNSSDSPKAEVAQQADTAVAEKNIVEQSAAELPSTNAVETPVATLLEQWNSDPRIRYGAYEIVGIDTVVTLREGQTMMGICRATLGAELIGYFQVVNDSATLKAGKVKVPKITVRRKK